MEEKSLMEAGWQRHRNFTGNTTASIGGKNPKKDEIFTYFAKRARPSCLLRNCEGK